MPEAPEVQAILQALKPLVEGQRIVRVRTRHAIAVRPQTAHFLNRKLAGMRIRGVDRRGKYLLLATDSGWVSLHFKFDGQLLWFERPEDTLQRKIHWDVAFDLTRGVLAFVDPRHLGRVLWLAGPEDSAGIRALGVDAFSAEFTAKRFSEICRERRGPIKLVLMDQKRIAGVGNIYSAEVLWYARLSPFRRSDLLSESQMRRLHKAVVSALNRALEYCLNPPPDFRNPQWWFSGVDKMLRVYDREGLPCRRCGTKIRRVEQGGRSTYFCPHCQRS